MATGGGAVESILSRVLSSRRNMTIMLKCSGRGCLKSDRIVITWSYRDMTAAVVDLRS